MASRCARQASGARTVDGRLGGVARGDRRGRFDRRIEGLDNETDSQITRRARRTQGVDDEILIVVLQPGLAEVVIDIQDKAAVLNGNRFDDFYPACVHITVQNTLEMFARRYP